MLSEISSENYLIHTCNKTARPQTHHIMLEFIHAQKFYGDRKILDIPSLHLEKGIYWLQGANGSGKTTLLRMIGGLLPFEGDIQVDAISQHRRPVAYRRSVSWADAEPLYPAFISGEELVNFYRDIRSAPAEQTDRLIAWWGMQAFLPTRIGAWSSGMIKKLSLLLAFIGSPRLILLDEPMITLDQAGIPLLYELIRESHRQQGTSFLISSHQPIEAGFLPVDKKIGLTDHTLQLLA